MKQPFLSAALIGALLLTACTGQQTDTPPTKTPPVTTPPVITQPTNNRVKIRSINFKDSAVANYMKYLTSVQTEMYADEVETLHLSKANSLDGLEYFTGLKTLIIDGEVNNTVDLSRNTLLEVLDIKADSLLLSKNNHLAQLKAQVQYIELPSINRLTQLRLIHAPVISPQSKQRYSATKNPSLGQYLKLDLSDQPQLTDVYLSGQFEEIVLPNNSQLERFTQIGSGTTTLSGLTQQKSLKTLAAVLDKNIQVFHLGDLPQLEELDLHADGLRSIDIYSLPKLQGLALRGENITQIQTDKNQSSVRWLRLDTPKISSFDLSAYSKIESFEYGNGQLTSLNFSYSSLFNLKLGNTQLKTLSSGRCAALASLDIGYNLLNKLDLSQCKALGFASILPSTAENKDPLESQLKLPANVVRNMPDGSQHRISELTAEDVSDERLLSCVQTSAAAEKSLYVRQLKNLNCRGNNDKSYYQSFESRQEGRADPNIKSFVFDVEGLELFSGLEAIDLGVNWISELRIDNLINLKKLNLEGNIIQTAYLKHMQSLSKLNLSSNPIYTLQIPPSLTQLQAASGTNFNGYVISVLGRYNLDILRESPEGAFITHDSFAQKFAVEDWPQLAALTDIPADRIVWPQAQLPGVERLRIEDLVLEDKRLLECIGDLYTFADEVKKLNCTNRGRVESNFIRSLKGLGQLKNLQELSLYGQALGELDISELTALKTLSISESGLSGIDFSKNPRLEDASIYEFNQQNTSVLSVDFSQNKNLRRIRVQGVSAVKLPDSDRLQFLSLQLFLKKIPTENKYPDLDLSRYSHLFSLNIGNRVGSLILPETSVLEDYDCYKCRPQALANLEKQTRLVNIRTGLPDELSQVDFSQFSRLRLVDIESETLKKLIPPADAQISHLFVRTPELIELNTSSLGRLEQLSLTTPKLAKLNVAPMPMLAGLLVSEYAFKQLDVSTLAHLQNMTMGDGALEQLTFGKHSQLENITIGFGQLKTLNFSNLTNLKTLSLGRNPLKTLDLQTNTQLNSLAYTQPITTDIRLPRLDYALPTTVVPAAKKIAQLAAADMPDAVLRTCVAAAAHAQAAVYTDELSQLSCTGEDGKERAAAMYNFINGTNLENFPCCIFDLTGLALFSNLTSLDLTGNWISAIDPRDINLHKLKTLNLDHNAIQTIEVPWGVAIGESGIWNQLRSVSLNANPLSSVALPENVRYLSAAAGDAWIYTEITLNNQFNKAPVLNLAGGLPLTLADYSRPFKLQYLGEDLQVNSTKLAPQN